MSFWTRVRKDLNLAFQEGIDLLKEGTAVLSSEARRVAKKGAKTVSSEASRITTISRLRYEIFNLNRQAQTTFTQIGGLVYEKAAPNPDEFRLDAKLKKMVQEAREIEEHISRLKLEIMDLQKPD
ncbi:MAG TPA: hypothetical protein VI702_06255 [Nitrospiria bacterium]